ncbi:hypothetical protein T439DRAFT_99352 [Meredithblackwellia eburnea MCA 4105]
MLICYPSYSPPSIVTPPLRRHPPAQPEVEPTLLADGSQLPPELYDLILSHLEDISPQGPGDLKQFTISNKSDFASIALVSSGFLSLARRRLYQSLNLSVSVRGRSIEWTQGKSSVSLKAGKVKGVTETVLVPDCADFALLPTHFDEKLAVERIGELSVLEYLCRDNHRLYNLLKSLSHLTETLSLTLKVDRGAVMSNLGQTMLFLFRNFPNITNLRLFAHSRQVDEELEFEILKTIRLGHWKLQRLSMENFCFLAEYLDLRPPNDSVPTLIAAQQQLTRLDLHLYRETKHNFSFSDVQPFVNVTSFSLTIADDDSLYDKPRTSTTPGYRLVHDCAVSFIQHLPNLCFLEFKGGNPTILVRCLPLLARLDTFHWTFQIQLDDPPPNFEHRLTEVMQLIPSTIIELQIIIDTLQPDDPEYFWQERVFDLIGIVIAVSFSKALRNAIDSLPTTIRRLGIPACTADVVLSLLKCDRFPSLSILGFTGYWSEGVAGEREKVEAACAVRGMVCTWWS